MIATTKKNAVSSTVQSLSFDDKLKSLLEGADKLDIELVKNVFTLVALTGEKTVTATGESCLDQSIEIAQVLKRLDVDSATFAAALLYSPAKYADLKSDDIVEQFGKVIGKLVHGTKQMASITDLYHASKHNIDNQKHNIDNIRKMLLAMVDDTRVVFIKLAERLVVLRRIAIFNEYKRKRYAKEIMAVYAPLANRLGITPIKWEMEDISFRYLDPTKYKKIATFLKENRIEREVYVKDFTALLKDMLAEEKIKEFNVYGRAKHIYSIYRKMQRKNVGPEEIYDVTAVRILVPNVEDCYQALSAVHTKWKHVPKEFDDYIATPKPNGYRSIHTVVIGPKKKLVEIQIRTFKMHDAAELGGAAHWLYKEGGKSKAKAQSSYEAKIAWLRQVMEWQKEVTEESTELSEAKDVFKDRVYVFTPIGDIFDLPQGATPLDLAYHIHTDLGHRCRGAKVNRKIAQLSYKLKTGDRVEILTTKHGAPSRDWLNSASGVLNTTRAKAKVLHWFKKQNYEENLASGKNLLDAEAKRLNIKITDLHNIAKKYNFKTTNDLLAALGSYDVKLNSVTNAIAEAQNIDLKDKKEIEVEKVFTTPIKKDKDYDFAIQGIDNLLTHLAHCCRPIPGDEIIGYITQNRGVSIHRQDCHNIITALKSRPERLIKIGWGKKMEERYPVDLSIIAFDRHGLIRDISNLVNDEDIKILGVNSILDKKDNIATINLSIEIKSISALSKILAKISKIQNVLEVKRSG